MKKLALVLLLLAGSSFMPHQPQKTFKATCCPQDCDSYCDYSVDPPRVRCCDGSLSGCSCK